MSRIKQLVSRVRRRLGVGSPFDDDPELSWFNPPTDPGDVGAWDRYWTAHLEHGLGPPIHDIFCADHELVRVMNNRRMRTILCAGNGISQEPKALAEAGFHVAALDCSPRATEIARSFEFPAQAFEQYCGPEPRRPEGKVEFVVGDILNPSVCPGPFDVIIERRTAQIFRPHERDLILGALAERLGKRGIFFSHSHDGSWMPPAERRHFTRAWFEKNGWTIWEDGPGPSPRRVAWLLTTTG